MGTAASPPASSTGPRRPLPALRVATLEGVEPPPRQWFVPDWIPDRVVTLLSGDGGTGKSLLGMQLATCGAAGMPFLGIDVAPRRVLYLAAEDDQDELHRRQIDLNAALGITMSDLEDRLWWCTLAGDETLLALPDERTKRIKATQTYECLREFCLQEEIQLVIVDTVADTFGGLEIDRQQVTKYVRLFEDIARITNGAAVLIAHPSNAGLRDGTGISGSSAWRNAVRSVLFLRRPETEDDAFPVNNDERVLERLKCNFAPARTSIKLLYGLGAFSLVGPPLGARAAASPMLNELRVMGSIRAALNVGVMPSSSKHSEQYYPKVLRRFEQVQGLTVRQVEAAAESMLARGELRVAHVGTGKNRRLVLVPAEHPPLPDERDLATGLKKGGSS